MLGGELAAGGWGFGPAGRRGAGVGRGLGGGWAGVGRGLGGGWAGVGVGLGLVM